MAGWGAYGINTQEALEADITSWITAEETWMFTARITNTNPDPETGLAAVLAETSLTPYRAPIPDELSTMILLGVGLIGLAAVARRKLSFVS